MPLSRRTALRLWLPLFVSGCRRRGEDPTPPQAEPPRSPGRDRTLQPVESLVAFARLYGYVRFFHPSDAAAEADWRKIAVHGIASLREKKTLGELCDGLADLFQPLAPSLALWVTPEPAPPKPPPPKKRDGLVFWQYLGFPGSAVSLHKPPYAKSRVGAGPRGRWRFPERPAIDVPFQTELVADLRLRMPIVLSRPQAESVGPAALSIDPELAAAATSPDAYESLDVRQGAIIEVWNVLRHFYPYQSEVEVDWIDALVDSLRRAESDPDLPAAVETLRRLVHRLHDGHGDVGHRRLARQRALPLRLEIVEGQPVVTATAVPDRVAIGDIVEAIGAERTLDRIGRLEQLLSGSKQWRRFRAAAWEAPIGPPGARETIAIVRGREKKTIELKYDQGEPLVPPRPPAIHWFRDGIGYVDLTRAEWNEIAQSLEQLAVAPGIVFDMRGYPNETHRILAHLLDEPEDALWMHVPRVVEPDGRIAAWNDLGWHLRPEWPKIQGAVAFLISPAAISYGESLLSYVEAHGLGTRVGEAPTAGANGDIVRLDTLGGFYVVFTGMRVTRHDGRPFHLEGVQPQIVVSRTIAGLRAGRDEELEAALADVRRRRPKTKLELPPRPIETPNEAEIEA